MGMGAQLSGEDKVFWSDRLRGSAGGLIRGWCWGSQEQPQGPGEGCL